jgi:NAD(P)-dependent dehydrogenase (short-subunit alcohol dehydrogenase family)
VDLDLSGRRVVITGASKGIGLACADVFAAEGCSLDLVARTESKLEAAAADLTARFGVDVRVHPLDLSRPADQVALADAVGADVDVLVNNAGAVPSGDLTVVDDETLRGAWELKVFGYINLCRLVVPKMTERGSGVIVNVIGGAGLRPQATYIAGGMGNAALMAMTQALGARSLRNGVRVVAVNPGLVVTDRMTDLLRTNAEARFGDAERWPELVPTDPVPGQPEQIADVVAFLASPRASHISGTTIPVDGGASSR